MLAIIGPEFTTFLLLLRGGKDADGRSSSSSSKSRQSSQQHMFLKEINFHSTQLSQRTQPEQQGDTDSFFNSPYPIFFLINRNTKQNFPKSKTSKISPHQKSIYAFPSAPQECVSLCNSFSSLKSEQS